ncbi:MAG TPA: hypothetical protein VI031_04685, partial [Pyrinomonadaceae bacterium]
MSAAPRMILRRRKRPTVNQEAFEKEFAFESLKSDRLRVTILIGAIVSALGIVLLMVLFFYDEFQAAFHGNFKGFLVAVFVIFGANLVYLLAERTVIDRLIKKRIRPFSALKYLSAFVETSIPTAGMIVGSLFLGPV